MTAQSGLMTQDKNQLDYTTDLSRITSPDFTFSKRQIGALLVILGGAGFLGLLLLDVLGGGREGGIGPAQSMALAIMAVVALLGLLLIAGGKKPI